MKRLLAWFRFRRAQRPRRPVPGLWEACGLDGPPQLGRLPERQRTALLALLHAEAARVLRCATLISPEWLCGLTVEEREALDTTATRMERSERVQAAMHVGQQEFLAEQLVGHDRGANGA